METFYSGYIDMDWEFDAPHWCDFTKEFAGGNDEWFDKQSNNTSISSSSSPSSKDDKSTEGQNDNSKKTDSSPKNKNESLSQKQKSRIPVSARRIGRTRSSCTIQSSKQVESTEVRKSSKTFSLHPPLMAKGASRIPVRFVKEEQII